MNARGPRGALVRILAFATVAGAGVRAAQEPPDAARIARLARFSPLPPLPADPTNRVADDPRAALLGQALFFDPALSRDGDVSCATCHDPAHNLSDGKPVAETLARGTRKTPTVVNAAYLRWLFWDGRADSLWAQAVEPIENPREMGGDRLAVAHRLARNPELRRAYEALFGPLPPLADGARFPAHARPVPDEPQHELARAWGAMAPEDRAAIDALYANVGKAVAAYERLLVRADAPFDRYVAALRAGEPATGILSPAALRGLDLFLGRAGCAQCHFGPTFTDSEFHATGAPPGAHGDPDDAGRYAGLERLALSPWTAAGEHSDAPDSPAARRITGLRRGSETWGEFRTPSLRNLLGRAPYMHAGQLPDLEAVVRFYSTLEGAVGRSHHQELVLRPLDLTDEEVAALVAFLEGLEGAPLDPGLLSPPPTPFRER